MLAFIVGLFEISLGAHFVLWGGGSYILPACIVLLAASHNWRQLIIWGSVYVLTGVFFPFSLMSAFLLIVVCCATIFLFRRVVAPDSLFVQAWIAIALMALYIAALYYSQGARLSLSYVGSLLLTLPIILIWFWIRSQHGRRLS